MGRENGVRPAEAKHQSRVMSPERCRELQAEWRKIAERTDARTPEAPTIVCSFCGKSDSTFVSGHGTGRVVYICRRCVGLCCEIFAETD